MIKLFSTFLSICQQDTQICLAYLIFPLFVMNLREDLWLHLFLLVFRTKPNSYLFIYTGFRLNINLRRGITRPQWNIRMILNPIPGQNSRFNISEIIPPVTRDLTTEKSYEEFKYIGFFNREILPLFS